MALGEAERVFGDYFAISPWERLPANAEGFDMGSGYGRWARFVAPRVGRLHSIDPSSALADQPNVHFYQASVAASCLLPHSQDSTTCPPPPSAPVPPSPSTGPSPVLHPLQKPRVCP